MNDDTKLGKGAPDMCKPLIEEREGKTIALVHFSAREYLRHRISGPYLSPFKVHANLTTACLRYLLSCDEFVTGTASASACGRIIKGFHDIFQYVQRFWVDHLLKCLENKVGSPYGGDLMRKIDELLGKFSQFQGKAGREAVGSSGEFIPLANDPVDAEPEELQRLPEIVRRYIIFRNGTSFKQTSSGADVGSTNEGNNEGN